MTRELPPNFRLAYGSHESPDEGMCAMEAVAYIAGEPHSDRPQCASPVLTNFCIRLNDHWNDDNRQLLLAVVPKLVGTRGNHERHVKQAFVLVDGHIREIVPDILEARGWKDLADKLRDSAPIIDPATARVARDVCEHVREEARKRRNANAYADVYAGVYAGVYADVYADVYAGVYADVDIAAYAAHAVAIAADVADVASAKTIVEKTLVILERAIAVRDEGAS